MNITRLIVTLVIILMLVVAACSHEPTLPLTVAGPSEWPTTWVGLSTDPNESGCNDHRNVADVNADGYALYYATDSQYLYLRMETVGPPGWPSLKPGGDARYKWWFDTAGTAVYVHGTTVEKAEFLLILEDLTDNSNDTNTKRDLLGELTLMDDLNNAGFTARWDQARPPNYTINNAQTTPAGNSSWWRRVIGTGTPGTGGPQGVMGADIGYRIDNAATGGNFVDMYVSWVALGNPSSLCLIWATDNQNNNLDQAPDCERPEETYCLPICVPPLAAFNATPTSGCVPLTVNFTDQSTRSPTSWNWSFPGGIPSSHAGQTPPPVTYNAAGSYNVTLIVSNACGSDNETKTVTVYANPTVSITPDGGKLTCATTFILLTADTTGSLCPVTGYQWYKNGVALDDETGSTLSATAPGTYKVEVECTNGCRAEDSAAVTEDTSRPTVNVANVATCEGETATLIATVSGCTAKSYQWYEGSSSSDTPIPGANSGTYLIPNAGTADAGAYTCLVECESSCKSEDHGTLTVNHSPTADFSGSPLSGCGPLTVVFTDLSTGAPTSWSWDVDGDGIEDYNTQNPSHTYIGAGTYTVSLTVSNACGSDSSTKDNHITAEAKPTPTASGNSPICEGSTIVLTGGPDGMTNYSWTGPNGFNSSSQNPTIPNGTTAMTGTYSLTVTDDGCTSDPASTVVVVNANPTATASSNSPICEGDTVQLSGGPDGMTSYSWTGPGGWTSSLQNPSRAGATIAMAGTYTLTVMGSNGCTDDASTSVTVNAKPTATASSNSPVCEGGTIVLTAGPDGMTNYSWMGPNGFSSSWQNPTIPNATLAMTGTYTLTVTDGGCVSHPVSTNVVVNKRPTAEAGPDREIVQGSSVVIGGSPAGSGGTAPYTYSWAPTSGLDDASIANPTASPSATTTYTVAVTDSKGCADSDGVTVTVIQNCCICGFVYSANTMQPLAGWEVILEKKTSPWHEVQRTVTDANGMYCICGLGAGYYRVSEVVKPGWIQASPSPNEHLVTLPGDCCDPAIGQFFDFDFENDQAALTVGWEASPIDKLAVLAPWIALFAVVIAGASLLVIRQRKRGTR
jgi:PKD repeat protein